MNMMTATTTTTPNNSKQVDPVEAAIGAYGRMKDDVERLRGEIHDLRVRAEVAEQQLKDATAQLQAARMRCGHYERLAVEAMTRFNNIVSIASEGSKDIEMGEYRPNGGVSVKAEGLKPWEGDLPSVVKHGPISHPPLDVETRMEGAIRDLMGRGGGGSGGK